MSRPGQRLLIVGGGIGGMAAAQSFLKQGVEVDLVDVDPNWRVYGAGITITGPTLRAFKQLGILEELGKDGAFSNQVKFFDADGNYIRSMAAPPLEPDIPGTGGVMRPALHKLMSKRTLAGGAKVRLGLTVESFVQDAEGVDVVFSDGSQGRYDMVVGADGAGSKMRALLLPDAPEPTFTGQGCWRLVADRPAEVDSAEIYFGPSNRKVGFNPCSDTQMYLFATVDMPGNPFVADDGLIDGMRDILEPFGGRIATIRETLGPDSNLNYRPLFAALVPPPWHVGRVGLIGDAVHATTPHLASGAGIAIEDGLVLAEEMRAAADVEAGWRAFTARRWERAKLVVENSVRIGALEQEGGREEEVRQVMETSTHALAQPI